MSKIITVTATTTEQAVTFDATYQFVWFRSLGDGDVLVSDHSGIIAGADDVALVKAGGSTRITVPYNKTVYVKAVSENVDMEIHAQNFSDIPFKSRAKGGGQSITVTPLSVTENGVYTAPTGTAYSPVTVDVQEEPWQPLEDGYSNFWFELTDDTLSPWLNFSAKTNNAVIDWGDGSGEVALDTLTPTHTYSKAGRYIVKVKGVTGIAAQQNLPTDSEKLQTIIYVELNTDVTTLEAYAFRYLVGLKQVKISNVLQICLQRAFQSCASLQDIDISTCTIDSVPTYMFGFCFSLSKVVLPSTITNIESYGFYSCSNLLEIHLSTTTPPTLGTNVFSGLPSNWLCYVPVGTGETYKAASGWSTYADHILEEGQTPNRAMVAKFNAMKKEVIDDGSDSNENR